MSVGAAISIVLALFAFAILVGLCASRAPLLTLLCLGILLVLILTHS